MARCKVKKNDNFTVMSNYHLKDLNLSLKAIGLLSKVLSLPETWDYTIKGLCGICKEEERALKSTLDELKKHGYLVVKKVPPNDKKNRFTYEYTFHEVPKKGDKTESNEQKTSAKPTEKLQITESVDLQSVDLQSVDLQSVDLQSVDLQVVEVQDAVQLNTNKLNTNKLNKDNIKEKINKKESFPKTTEKVTSNRLDFSFIENEDLIAAFKNFADMRKRVKAPLTQEALKLAVDKVFRLSSNQAEQLKIIEKSIFNSWKGLFPLKKEDLEEINKSQADYQEPLGEDEIRWLEEIKLREEKRTGV